MIRFRKIAALSGAVAVAAATVAALSVGAARAQDDPDPGPASGNLVCLWETLPTVLRLRLELGARTGEGLPASVLARIGEDGLATRLVACGLEPGPEAFAEMARYWVARATLSMAEERVRIAGLPLDAARAAFDAAVPAERLLDTATDLLAAQLADAPVDEDGATDEAEQEDDAPQSGLLAAEAVAAVVAAVEAEVQARRRAQAEAVAEAQAAEAEGDGSEEDAPAAPWLNPDAAPEAFELRPAERFLIAEFAAASLLTRGIEAGAQAPAAPDDDAEDDG